jgi:phytoene synthase
VSTDPELSPAAPPDVAAAYEYCEQVTKAQARNFSYGIALLPGDKRRALSAVYAYARRIDDIGDGDLPPQEKMAALGEARVQVTGLAGGPVSPSDPVLIALADAASRFPIPLSAFGELIEGCEADVTGTVYRTFDDLEHYCRCVAGSIGRLSLGVFGTADPATAAPLADDLGVALQLTNILRDIREDLGNGRVYLPAEDLARFGVTLTPGRVPWPGDPATAGQGPGIQSSDDQLDDIVGMERLIRFEVERARGWYASGLRLMPMLDWRSAASAGAMAGIYLRLLSHISATPGEVLRRRMSLPAKEKVMVAVRSLAGRTPRPPAGVPIPARSGTRTGQAGAAVVTDPVAPSDKSGQADAGQPGRPVPGGAP